MLGLPSCSFSFTVRQIVVRLIVCVGTWLVLTKGDIQSWPFALPTIFLAVWVSLLLAVRQEYSLRPSRVICNLPYFLYKSLISGVDVMVRVLHPRLPIDPGFIEYSLTIPHEAGRVFLANSISLLPGTISARLTDHHLIIHTLDKELSVLATIRELEVRVDSLYSPSSSINTNSVPS
nr:Na+/H+ antiporter subunit E [Desulfobulbaceae bacterium]